MNYRHIYHAGNFADVFKHIIVARIITYLKHKDQAFRVIDTHSGIGLYDLSSQEAQKTGEWHNGVARIFKSSLSTVDENLLEPWIEVLKQTNGHDIIARNIQFYPGSPCLIRSLLRKQDRLTAIELHDKDYKKLAALFAGDYQTRVLHLNGWLALGAHVPPKEKRGLILVDPPFEEQNEFERLQEGLQKAYRRFSTGIYALWYPVKYYDQVEKFVKALRDTKIPKILRLEIRIRKPGPTPLMDGCGMIVVNPPFVLDQEMAHLAPLLSSRLGEDGPARIIREWIRKEEN